jgi:hypothetical protein
MTSSDSGPGSKVSSGITSGDLSVRPIPKTCGPVCIAAPLYVALSWESLQAGVASGELISDLERHSGHIYAFLMCNAPSATSEPFWFVRLDFSNQGRLQSSSPGPVESVSGNAMCVDCGHGTHFPRECRAMGEHIGGLGCLCAA